MWRELAVCMGPDYFPSQRAKALKLSTTGYSYSVDIAMVMTVFWNVYFTRLCSVVQ